MKIMMVITGMCTGGAERVMATLCNDLSQRHQVRLVCMRQEDSDYPLAHAVEFVKGNIADRSASKAVRFVKSQMEAWQPEVVLSFMTKSNVVTMAASLMARHKAPVIVAERANPYVSAKAMKISRRFLYPFASGAVFQTKQAQDYYKRIVKCPAVILKNPLNPDFKAEPYQGQRRKAIVTMGRLSEEKNQKLLIDAFCRIADDYPEYSVEIYGDGPDRAALAQRIAQTGMTKRILLMGRKSQVQEYIRDAEIFVLTSNAEGMPNALLEAMAMGLVSISTDCPIGGPAVVIKQDENGILIPMNGTAALENALRKAIEDRAFAQRLSQNAVKVLQEYDTETVCAQWEAYILSVIKRAGDAK